MKGYWRRLLARARPPFASVVTAVTVALAITIMLPFMLPPRSNRVNVAFIGNSMMFVNDLPRFMEELSGFDDGGHYNIRQRSCLHGSLNFATMLRKGNGMYDKWRTDNARIANTYDFGMCTVPQLLMGYDPNLTALNANGFYKIDGKNPCFRSESYYDYLMIITAQQRPHWDFVVMNDQSKYPAIESRKNTSLAALKEKYVPMLLDTNAIPVLYATHGYESSNVNVTMMGNVSVFTSRVFEGYRQYAALLDASLSVTPRIAPVGLAFLVVYEDRPDMWSKLFFVDGFHPSPHGTMLLGFVLYATLYGYMPSLPAANPKFLWKRARKMQIGNQYVMPFPTYDEAAYLYYVAHKVMVLHHRPETWIQYYTDDEEEYIDYIPRL